MVPIKFKLGNEIRRISIKDDEKTYEKILEKISEIFSEINVLGYGLKYLDEEGDLVTITDTYDVIEAFSAKDPKRVLTINLIVNNNNNNEDRKRKIVVDESFSNGTIRRKHAAYCDHCNAIIEGTRYKCIVCSDFDLCEKCKVPNAHTMGHLFIEIEKPIDYINFTKLLKNQGKKHQERSQYGAKFIEDITIDDGEVLKPSTEYKKVWKLQNTKNINFPSEFNIIAVGDTIVTDEHIINFSDKIVNSHDFFNVEVSFKTPATPGHYKAFFRLTDDSNLPFGDHLWVEFTIEEQKEKSLENRINDLLSLVPAEFHKSILQVFNLGFDIKDVIQLALEHNGDVMLMANAFLS